MRPEVLRGAELLDRVVPGWVNKVDVVKLDLESCSTCILGQVFGDFFIGWVSLFPPQLGKPIWQVGYSPTYYGFNLERYIVGDPCAYRKEMRQSPENYEGLRRDWVEAIVERCKLLPA